MKLNLLFPNLIFILFYFFPFSSGLIAQDSKIIFSSTEIVWYGLDFTKTKFVGGGFGYGYGYDLKIKFIPNWNALTLNEPQNFDLKRAFRKNKVIIDIRSVNKINSKIDPDECISYNEANITKDSVTAMVKLYKDFEKKEGVGLSFVVVNFNKSMQRAEIYVAFFDIATKNILLCEKMGGKAGGAGLRNYWAGAIKAILVQIDEAEYKNWKKESKFFQVLLT